jgi:hypothetical protein
VKPFENSMEAGARMQNKKTKKFKWLGPKACALELSGILFEASEVS